MGRHSVTHVGRLLYCKVKPANCAQEIKSLYNYSIICKALKNLEIRSVQYTHTFNLETAITAAVVP